MRLFIVQVRGSISGRVNSGSSIQSIDLKAGIIGDDDLSRSIATVTLSLLPSVGFKRQPIFNNWGEGREARYTGNIDAVPRRRAGKVPQFPRIRSSDKNAAYQARHHGT